MRNLEGLSMPSRSFESASITFNGLNLLITFQKIEKYFLLLLPYGKKQSYTLPITSSACHVEINKNGLNVSHRSMLQKVFMIQYSNTKSAIRIYSSIISIYHYK